MKNKHVKHKKVFISLLVAIIMASIFAGTVFATQSDGEPDDSTSASIDKRVPLTQDEKAYVEEHPTVVVAADASWRPLEYLCDEDGQYEGVIHEVFNKLEAYTGFKFEYKVMDSYADALKAVQSGKADLISGIADDEEIAKEYNVNLSEHYLTINSAVIAKNDVSKLYNGTSNKKIAVVNGDYANPAIKAKIANADLKLCSSNEECLDLVKSEKVDMAIMATYCSEYYMTVPKYSSLKSHTISDFSWNQAFGVCKNTDPRLTSIINKGITHMADYDLNEAVYEGIINSAYSNDFMVMVYKHPFLVIGVVLAIVFIIGALLLTIYLSRRQERNRVIDDATRLKLALAKTKLCIWELDLRTDSITKIDNEHEKHGFANIRENISQSVIENGYIHPEDIENVRDVFEKVYNGQQDVHGSWRVKNLEAEGADTVYWWEHVLMHIMYDEKHKPIKVIGVSEDITSEKNAQKDSLTSVYTRNSFEKKASFVLNERRNAYLQCAYLILDLDGFKGINDTYGHGMGDKVLIAVGSILNKTFRASDIVGRLGGDEFTIFMTSISKKEDAETKAKQVVDNICKLQEENDFPFPVSCSLGVVVAMKGQADLDTLYKKADIALYDAKHAGKNQFKVYEECTQDA